MTTTTTKKDERENKTSESVECFERWPEVMAQDGETKAVKEGEAMMTHPIR